MALIDKLTAIANAIRGKTGVTDELTLDEMAAEIENLEVGGGSEENTMQWIIDTWASGQRNSGFFAETLAREMTDDITSRLLGGVNLSEVTRMTFMFQHFESLTDVPAFLNTSHVAGMAYMFQYCSGLTDVHVQFDTSNVTSMLGMFSNCHSLTSVSQLDTSRVTDMQEMFYFCSALIAAPQLNTSKVTSMKQMFGYCNALTTVPQLDLRNVDNAGSMFYQCSNLTECWIRNIKTTLSVGVATAYGHLLTVDSLIHLIYELRDTGSTKTLTVGAANLEKLASVYVKTIDITDETRAEDDLVDEKLPFVVCESTDEGATLITDYVQLKNWSVK